jgi:hypothetical protein
VLEDLDRPGRSILQCAQSRRPAAMAVAMMVQRVVENDVHH